jgi:hypothetical protein
MNAYHCAAVQHHVLLAAAAAAATRSWLHNFQSYARTPDHHGNEDVPAVRFTACADQMGPDCKGLMVPAASAFISSRRFCCCIW